VAIWLCVAVLGVGAAFAQTAVKPAPPSTQPAGEALEATVVSVQGPAEKLVTTNGQKWEPLKSGEKLGELTIIRTGLRAEVVLRFPDTGEVTVRRCTKMGIGQFRREGAATKTSLGLKYGAVRADVRSVRGPTDFQIATPVATLSVGGSLSDIIYSAVGGHQMRAGSGNWGMNSSSGRHRNIWGGQTGGTWGGNITPHKINQMAMRFVQVTDVMGGVTQGERHNIMNYRGAMGPLAFLLLQNPHRSIPVLSNNARPTHLATQTPTPQGYRRRSQPSQTDDTNGDSNGDRDKFYP